MKSSLLGLLVVLSCIAAHAGDSAYGVVKEVRSANVVVVAVGRTTYVIRLVGVKPAEAMFAEAGKEFVSRLVLGRPARFYIYRKEGDEFVALLRTADAESGFRDVGLELIRAGLGRATLAEHFYKYGELAASEDDARTNARGIWAKK